MYRDSKYLGSNFKRRRANAVATAIELVISKTLSMLKRILTIEALFLYVYDVVVYQTKRCVAPCVTRHRDTLHCYNTYMRIVEKERKRERKKKKNNRFKIFCRRCRFFAFKPSRDVQGDSRAGFPRARTGETLCVSRIKGKEKKNTKSKVHTVNVFFFQAIYFVMNETKSENERSEAPVYGAL